MKTKTKLVLKPEAARRVAKSLGFEGDMRKFSEFLASSAAGQMKMARYKKAAKGMVIKAAEGVFANKRQASIQSKIGDTVEVDGKKYVKTAGDDPTKVTAYLKPVEETGGDTANGITDQQQAPQEVNQFSDIGTAMVQRAANPTLQGDQRIDPQKIKVTDDTLLKEGTGELGDTTPVTAETATTTTAKQPDTFDTATTEAAKTLGKLPKAETKKGEIAPQAVIDPRTQTDTALSDMKAATTTARKVEDAPTRTVQEGELDIDATVDQTKVGEAFGTGEVQAASVQDELAGLMSQFEGGSTPAWASGGMRRANQIMAQRGLSASSMAGQAIIQAAMESALPIAQIDAGNKQQMAMMKAEQRAKFLQIEFDQAFQSKVMKAAKVSEIANMNFSAEQQIALENARMAQTVDLANLNNKQALILAEAAQLSQLEITNLNNRQQAEVMNAQNFLAMDMKNLDIAQQTEVFNTQNAVQGMFNDQAAENASRQFNASSENQVNQFFASLKSQVEQFNASQTNGLAQFNAGQTNAIAQFNANVQNQRDQFNAQNQMVIAQNNVQWRRAVSTGDTAAINRANELNATALLNMSSQAYQNLWQEHADSMERAWKTAENSQDRLNSLAAISMQGEVDMAIANKEAKSNSLGLIGNLVGKIINPFS